ncbi:Chromate resistance protein ChrB [Streptomyces sp. NPDC057002]|uniref:Chromate resistance protein ChrB n=1 Tax=Streptomyces sp. NPDC057002 TaxID=3345992 RepID=UPI00362CC28E
MTFRASGRSAEDVVCFEALFTAARSVDWTEFLAGCGKFEEVVAKEIRIGKFTLAELEEGEQGLERLRRWHRDVTVREVFGAPEGGEAAKGLEWCVGACEGCSEQVFAALHQSEGESE